MLFTFLNTVIVFLIVFEFSFLNNPLRENIFYRSNIQDKNRFLLHIKKTLFDAVSLQNFIKLVVELAMFWMAAYPQRKTV